MREMWMEIMLHSKRYVYIYRCDVFEGLSTNIHFER